MIYFLTSVFSDSVIELRLIVISQSDGSIISSVTVDPLVAADIQGIFNIAISGTSAFYSASISVLTQAQLDLSVDVRDLGLFVFDSFISIEQRVEIEAALLTLYSSNLNRKSWCILFYFYYVVER